MHFSPLASSFVLQFLNSLKHTSCHTQAEIASGLFKLGVWLSPKVRTAIPALCTTLDRLGVSLILVAQLLSIFFVGSSSLVIPCLVAVLFLVCSYPANWLQFNMTLCDGQKITCPHLFQTSFMLCSIRVMQEVDALMVKLDTDGGGEIEIDEWRAFYVARIE